MIGKVPDGWRIEKLGNISRVFTGSSAPQDKKYFDNGVYPFVRVSDLSNKKFNKNLNCIRDFINDTCLKETTQTFAKKGTILFAKSGMSVRNNHRAILENDSYIVSHLCAIYTDDKIVREYIYYLLCKIDMVNYSENEAYPSLKTSIIKSIPIPLPPLPQQEKIVKVLDITSALIEKQKELIEKYNLFLKSKFIETFGNPIHNPMGWEVVELGKVIEILTDYHANGSYKTLKKHVELLNKKDYALMIRTTDLEKNNFEDDVKYISQSAYKFLSKTKVYGHEIIMNKIGSAGSIFLMPILNRPVSLGMNQFLIRLTNNCNSIFLYNLLQTEYGKRNIEKQVRGAVTKSITKDAVRGIDIPLPPIELQNKFALLIEKIETIKEQENKKLEQIETLHNSLMDKAFKGEIK